MYKGLLFFFQFSVEFDKPQTRCDLLKIMDVQFGIEVRAKYKSKGMEKYIAE